MFMPARTLIRDERGMSLVFVGLGLMGFVAASMLAIDVGMLMTARAQAQNSADAGAHAGAVALGFDNYDDRSSTGPAVTNAVQRALANKVMAGNVSVTPADVTFPIGPTGLNNRVRVHVYRDAVHGNPMNTFIAQLFGTLTMDISAVATAEASPASAVDCVLPFALPDRWNERTLPPFNSMTSDFDYYTRVPNGQVLANPDQYVPLDQDGYTGYTVTRDKGTLLRLKAGHSTTVSPSIYFPVVLPGSSRGADEVRDAISGCYHAEFEIGHRITVDPGGDTGPVRQGVDDLVAKDPDAYWDDAKRCPARGGRCISSSPRIRPIPLYDPFIYETGKQTGRNADFQIANVVGVFVIGNSGNEVLARVWPIAGTMGSGGGTVPANAFPVVIRIVE